MIGAYVEVAPHVGYVILGDGCWEWVGIINHAGYGRIELPDDRIVAAHRFTYERARGPIPDGLQIDHLCRNRRCVNPAHLEAVTGRVNVLRGVGLTAQNAKKTHCPKGHPYNGNNLYVDRIRRRYCQTCHRTRMAAYRAKLRERP